MSEAGVVWEAANALLDRTVTPPRSGPCGVTVVAGEGAPLEGLCPSPDPGASAQQAPGSQLVLEEVASFETPRFWTETRPLAAGVEGVVVRVHGYGTVAAMDAEGDTLWQRTSLSYFDEWGLEPWVVPLVHIGRAPTDPFTWASERAFAVGDLTGDGRDEVVVAHVVHLQEPEARGVSVVTMLDGANGETLWHRLHAGAVTEVLIADGTLFVGEETGPPTPQGFDLPMGEVDTASRLHALRFADAAGGPVASDVWTLETARAWARWLALAPAGEGRLAAAWTDKPTGAEGDAGRVVVLDTADGQPVWERVTHGYPRALRHDPGRGLLVVHEQADPIRPVVQGVVDDFHMAYTLTGLAAADGAERLRVERDDAILLALAVSDVTGDGAADWVTGDATVPGLPANAVKGPGDRPIAIPEQIESGRIIVVDGDDGEQRWQQESNHDAAGGLLLTYGLSPVDAQEGALLVAGSFGPAGADLRVLAGADGGVRWHVDGEHVAFPLSISAVADGGVTRVVAVTEKLAVRSHDLDDGDLHASTPLLADVFAATVTDVSADGHMDLVLGTAGGGVFAVDSSTLSQEPRVLWRAAVGDSVRMLQAADVTGDGEVEVVVAASTAVHVLRSSDGGLLYTIDYPDEFVWTVTLGDLTGDGVADITVPTRTLAGYGGTDGRLLWRYRPAGGHFSTAVVAHGKAVAAFNPVTRSTHFAVAIDGATGEVAWEQAHVSPLDITRLWRSVALLPGQGHGGGDAVGFLYDARRVTDWRPAAMVYDLSAGDLLWRSGPAESGSVHEQALVRDGDLHQLTWQTVGRFRSDAADFIGLQRSGFTAAFVDFGALGEALLLGGSWIVAYPPEIPWAEPAEHLEPVATWSRLHTEELLVADLTGDGSEEVVTFKQDDEARSLVNAFEGTVRLGWTFLPFGVAILRGAEG